MPRTKTLNRAIGTHRSIVFAGELAGLAPPPGLTARCDLSRDGRRGGGATLRQPARPTTASPTNRRQPRGRGPDDCGCAAGGARDSPELSCCAIDEIAANRSANDRQIKQML